MLNQEDQTVDLTWAFKKTPKTHIEKENIGPGMYWY